MAAHGAIEGPTFIEVDDSIVSPAPVPAGAYDLSDTTVQGDRSRSTSLTLLEFQEGATLTVFPPRSVAMRYATVSSAPVFVSNVPVGPGPVLKLDDASLQSEAGAAPLIRVDAGTINVFCQGGGLALSNPVIDLAVAGALLNLTADWSAVVLQDTVSGVAGTGVALIVRSPANFVLNTFPGPTYLGSLITLLPATADKMGYTPAVSANWAGTDPVDIADALDRIAAHVGPVT